MPTVTFIARDGKCHTVQAVIGQTLLQVARAHNIDIEGACEGNLACSTCHVIVDDGWIGRLPPPAGDESDMLDLAHGVTRGSRLACQIKVTEALDSLVIRIAP